MQCEEWADANSELFKEAHDETVHKNSYKRKLYELISASLIQKMPRAAAVSLYFSPFIPNRKMKLSFGRKIRPFHIEFKSHWQSPGAACILAVPGTFHRESCFTGFPWYNLKLSVDITGFVNDTGSSRKAVSFLLINSKPNQKLSPVRESF
jgi:hypothetical protein